MRAKIRGCRVLGKENESKEVNNSNERQRHSSENERDDNNAKLGVVTE